ncbi:hypothetical protein ACQZV8_01255 [Magnetococcales bacterium HHB-1]
MWVFLEGGRFLSIVADKEHPDRLLVRARLPGDIETDFPEAKISEHQGLDYRYQASIPRQEVINAILDELTSLTYDHFRKKICNKNRVNAFTRCHQAMCDAQEFARTDHIQESVCQRD